MLSADAARRDFAALSKTVSRGLQSTIFVALPATVGLLLVSRPVVAVILQRGQFSVADTDKTAMTLSFYAIGLVGYFAQQVLTRAFYSLQESRIPAQSAVLAVVINLVLNLILVWPLGTGGWRLPPPSAPTSRWRSWRRSCNAVSDGQSSPAWAPRVAARSSPPWE